jgi:hypothetical protein
MAACKNETICVSDARSFHFSYASTDGKLQARLALARVRTSTCDQHSDLPDEVSAAERLEIYNLCLEADSAQKAVVLLHATMSLVTTTLHIDLTSEAEHCAMCSTILGEGSGKASLVYVLKDCRCVSLFILMLDRIIDGRKVICGLCVQFPGVPPFLPCQHADHLNLGRQRPLRLYNLKCAICLDLDDATRIALICGKFT